MTSLCVDELNELSTDEREKKKCICSKQLIKVNDALSLYDGNGAGCDICGEMCGRNEMFCHCDAENSNIHPDGYDTCDKCAKQKQGSEDELNKLNMGEREKGIKILIKIIDNILNNPYELRYGNLNLPMVTKKLNHHQVFIELLLETGFDKSSNGQRLVFNIEKMNKLIMTKHLLTCYLSQIKVNDVIGNSNIHPDGYDIDDKCVQPIQDDLKKPVDDENILDVLNLKQKRSRSGLKGNIYVSRDMTQEMIPFSVKTTISGKKLYEYMDGSTGLQSFDEFNTGQFRILNYDFYDKETNERLYCIVDRQNKIKGYQWKMRDKLFTAKEIENVFCVFKDKLPQSSRDKPSVINQLNHQNTIKNLIKNQYQHIVHQINWSKIPIFNRKGTQKRNSLCLTKPTFRTELLQFISNNSNDDNNNIIPMVMFNDDGGHHIEYIQIVKICNNSIGISYKYDQQKKCIQETAIYLNKDFIDQQHQLISIQHECHCLSDFKSDIDYLQIGDPNKQNNQLMYYQDRCRKLTKFAKDSVYYFQKTASNPANMTIKNLQNWTEKANKVITNDKNNNIDIDSSSLYSAGEHPDNTALRQSPSYITRLEQINNFYFQQTLNPIKQPIIPHPIHQSK